jgi:hypothetical protein
MMNDHTICASLSTGLKLETKSSAPSTRGQSCTVGIHIHVDKRTKDCLSRVYKRTMHIKARIHLGYFRFFEAAASDE